MIFFFPYNPHPPIPRSISAPFRVRFGSVSALFWVRFGSVSGCWVGSGRGASVRENLWKNLWNPLKNLWKPIETSSKPSENPPSKRPSQKPSQRQIALSEALATCKRCGWDPILPFCLRGLACLNYNICNNLPPEKARVHPDKCLPLLVPLSSPRWLIYPLTRKYYENNSLRIIYRNYWGILSSRNVQEKKTFKELRVRFVIFRKSLFQNNFS